MSELSPRVAAGAHRHGWRNGAAKGETFKESAEELRAYGADVVLGSLDEFGAWWRMGT